MKAENLKKGDRIRFPGVYHNGLESLKRSARIIDQPFLFEGGGAGVRRVVELVGPYTMHVEVGTEYEI